MFITFYFTAAEIFSFMYLRSFNKLSVCLFALESLKLKFLNLINTTRMKMFYLFFKLDLNQRKSSRICFNAKVEIII